MTFSLFTFILESFEFLSARTSSSGTIWTSISLARVPSALLLQTTSRLILSLFGRESVSGRNVSWNMHINYGSTMLRKNQIMCSEADEYLQIMLNWWLPVLDPLWSRKNQYHLCAQKLMSICNTSLIH